MHGTVTSFDDRRGLGTVRSDDGIDYPFHSTRIANGTRTVAVGAKVDFEVVPGNLGHWEAAEIIPG